MTDPSPSTRNVKLVLKYDGTDFSGWQFQPDRRTVQGELDRALTVLTGTRPTTNASGRTDAGVHALGQVVNFRTGSRHPCAVFHKALNATLPPDLRILSAEDVPEAFHATLDAKSKRYRYVIDNGPVADPFARRYAWHIYPRLDAPAMKAAGAALLGRHDFRSFETHWPNRKTSVRTIFDLDVARYGDRVIVEVEADGFLYNMVRTIAGTLSLVGTGRRPSDFPGRALAALDRAQAGPTAPPQGLFLLRVIY